MMESVVHLLMIAVLVEAMTEWVTWLTEEAITYQQVAALLLGQVLAWGAGMDLLAMLDVPAYPYVGIVLAGMVVARGANWAHDIMDRVRGAVAR